MAYRPQRRDNQHVWSTLQLTIVASILVSPFWFMASTISDGDEIAKSGMGAGLAMIAGVLFKIVGNKSS